MVVKLVASSWLSELLWISLCNFTPRKSISTLNCTSDWGFCCIYVRYCTYLSPRYLSIYFGKQSCGLGMNKYKFDADRNIPLVPLVCTVLSNFSFISWTSYMKSLRYLLFLVISSQHIFLSTPLHCHFPFIIFFGFS